MIGRIVAWLREVAANWSSWPSSTQPAPSEVIIPPPPSPYRFYPDSWLVAAPPGHGKSTFLWAICTQLDTVSRRSSNCMVTWPNNDPVAEISDRISQGHLPPPTPESAEAIDCDLILRGDQFPIHFADRRDEALSPQGAESLDLLPWPQTVVALLDVPQWLSVVEPGVGLGSFGLRLVDWIRPWTRSGPVQLVLVVNRADRILNLPGEIIRHLSTDPWSPGAGDEAAPENSEEFENLWSTEYREVLEQNSGLLRTWLTCQPGGAKLLDIADQHAWEPKICAVSSIGSSPSRQGDRLILPWAPKRVLDPLIWTLHLEPPGIWHQHRNGAFGAKTG